MFSTQNVGKKISALRKEKNMTQMELADLLGVSYQAVSNWERGNSMPDISKLPELSKIFSCDIDVILGNSKETELARHIIDNTASSYVSNNDVTYEEVAQIIPLVKPEETKHTVKTIVESKKPSIKDLAEMAPFLEDDFLEELIEDLDCADSPKDILLLAPFLSSKALGKLADKAIKNGQVKDMAELAPFLDEPDLEHLIDKLDNAGSYEDILSLAPFLSSKALGKLAEKVVAIGQSESLAGLAPFLDGQDLEHLVIKLLKEGRLQPEDCLALYPHLSNTAMRNVASYFMKGRN